MIDSPLSLIVWAFAAGVGVLAVGIPVVMLAAGLHAVITRHRNLQQTHLHYLQTGETRPPSRGR